MRKYDLFSVGIITLILFFIPFFWLSPGFLNLGGDGGRLYLFDPLSVLGTALHISRGYNVYSFANIPYTLFIYIVSRIVSTPTNTIAFEYGLQVSLSFLGIFLVVSELLRHGSKSVQEARTWVSITSGMVYLSFVTKVGWSVAFVTQNQVFLNPFIFYFLLKYCLTRKPLYIYLTLATTFIFSSNFGLTSSPQLFSFFPISIVFLLVYVHFVAKKRIPWKGLVVTLLAFVGIHSFHLLPVIAVLFAKDSYVNTRVFNATSIQNEGVHYFLTNHTQLGKMSVQIFQSWLGNHWYSVLIPLIAVSGFIQRKTKLLGIVGAGFLVTLFLVTANITHIGVTLYSKLFYIPGFLMFRSFDEKWFFVFSFFYVLLFALSLYYSLEQRSSKFIRVICLFLMVSVVWNLRPFFSGTAIHTIITPSNNVSTVYKLDPDFIDALSFVKTLPPDGKVLTLPLTYTYFQIARGIEGGAYIGISPISNLVGRQDFAGLWLLENYREPVLNALREENKEKIIQLLSFLNIRYIFYNTDTFVMENIPRFYDYSDNKKTTEIPPLIQDHQGYKSLLALLPVKRIYQQGSYEIHELETSTVRPLIHAPDIVVASRDELPVDEYDSAFVDNEVCELLPCNKHIGAPTITYEKTNSSLFSVVIETHNGEDPFLVVLSNPFDTGWDLSLDHSKEAIQGPIMVNGYANGWIIDPKKMNGESRIQGKIQLTYQNYFYVGCVIAGITGVMLLCFIAYTVRRRSYEKK